MKRTCTAGKEWFNYLCDNCLGSSGYRGSLAGMRKQFWGKDAFVVRCCGYLFRVSKETFTRVAF